MTYKASNALAPRYLSKLLVYYGEPSLRQSEGEDLFVLRTMNTTVDDRAIDKMD